MINFQIFILIVIILIVLNSVISIDLKLKSIRQKTKNILHESFNKTRGMSQVGPKPGSYLDYPGLSIDKLQTITRLWDLYYKCLEEFQKTVHTNNIFQAKIITAFRSSLVSLECELCVSPKHLIHKDVWYYSWLGNSSNLSLIKENDYFRISSLDLSLTIINMDESKSGYYQCKLDNSEAGPYFVELIKDNELIIDVNNTKINQTKNFVLEDLNLKIWTFWTQWSSCSKCDKMGKKIKFGHCMISLNSSIVYKGRKNEVNIKHSKTKRITMNHNHEVQWLKSLMNVFDMGLPCQSSLLLSNYSSNLIKQTATKVMIEYCEVKCNNDDIFEIKDIHGNLKERVNNSAGIYSQLQIMPELPPKVETLVIITTLNEQLCVTCPGNLYSNAPYEWRSNNQVIISTNASTTIDILNRLIFKNITEYDENIFTCWQVDNLAGIVQIKIVKEFGVEIQNDIHVYGVYLVIGIFIWVGFKIFIDRDVSN